MLLVCWWAATPKSDVSTPCSTTYAGGTPARSWSWVRRVSVRPLSSGLPLKRPLISQGYGRAASRARGRSAGRSCQSCWGNLPGCVPSCVLPGTPCRNDFAGPLRAALSLDPLPRDGFSVVAAWAALVVAACESRPVLVVLDDGQWCDATSLEAVLFSARRLHDVPVATLVAVREPPRAAAVFDGLDRLELGVLDHASATLLATREAWRRPRLWKRREGTRSPWWRWRAVERRPPATT